MKNTYTLFLIFLGGLFFITSCNVEDKTSSSKIPGSYKAMEQFSKIHAYPDGVPTTGYMQAYKVHKRAIESQKNLRNADWQAMGPWNTAGRTLTIGVNPQDDNTIYVGSASGGLWRSRNLGLDLSWERIETGFPVLGVSTIAFADQDSTVMFIGTGEVYNVEVTGNDGAYRATRGSYGIGILKSTDGGENWTHSLDWTYSQNEGVWMIKVAKTDPNIVYAGTTQGVHKSIDQGETWELVFENPIVTDVEIDPSDPNKIVIACGNFDTAGKGVYYSEDGGENWTQSNGIPSTFMGKIQLAQSTSDPDIFYASVGNGFGGGDEYTWLLRSDDGGKNFMIRNEFDYSRWQGWFSHDVAIDPDDPDEIIVVGINMFKSINGGLSLLPVSNAPSGLILGDIPILGPDGPSDYTHSDHHFILYHPAVEDLILIGTDGGVFISYDGGTNIRSANAGLQTTQFYNGFSVSDVDENKAIGGLQDNSTSFFKGTQAWSREIGGDGSWTAINDENQNILFGSFQNLRIRKSVNGGNSWFSVSPSVAGDRPLFIAPFVISKSNPDILYAGGTFLHKTFNGGENWNITNEGEPLNGDPIFALDVSDVDENIVYAGTAPQTQLAALFTTQDGGETFTEVNPVSDRIVNDIAVFPGAPGSAIAVYSGFGTGHVYRTDSFGVSWMNITNNLPDVPTNAVAINPYNLDEIYIGNDLGVYISQDGGVSWEPYVSGMPSAFIALDLKISKANNMLWVATHGNGAYQTPLETLPANNENQVAEMINIFPNPTQDRFTIEGLSNNNVISIFSYDGKKVMEEINKNSVQIGNLSAGSYFVIIEDKALNKEYRKTIIKQ